MTILEKVQSITGSTNKVLETLVDMCKDEATQYCNLEIYTERLDNAVVQMVIERFNRLNNEGVESTSASSINEKFINGYSQSTISMLNKNRKIKVVGY